MAVVIRTRGPVYKRCLLESESVDLIATDPPLNKGRDFHADPKSLKKEKSGGSFVDRPTLERIAPVSLRIKTF